MSEPIKELKAHAQTLAHHLMKPRVEPAKLRDRCRRRTLRLLKSGRLVKRPCEACGAEDVVAHHENYRRPDYIRWVCHRCHVAVHHRGLVLPPDLPNNPTDDEFCRWVTVVALRVVALLPEKAPPITPKTPYVPKAEALAIAGVSDEELRKAVAAGEVKMRGRRYRRKDLEAL